jgi:hypothetical protein
MREFVGPLALCVLLVGTTWCVPLATADTDTETSEDVLTESITSEFDVNYRLEFDTHSHTLSVNATNPTDQTRPAGAAISADNRTVYNTQARLSPDESWNETVETRHSLDALRTKHAVRVSTYGDSHSFEFEYEVDPETSTTVPTPHIAGTEVTRGTIDGEPSTVVNVTVVNPSNQSYPTKLMVHTQGTDGSLYFPTARPGESETVTVELLDSSDAVVVGEARLYVDSFNRSENGIDQVGFRGRVGGETAMWNESYVAVEGPWSSDPYRYSNASVSRPGLAERVSDGREVGGVPVAIPLVGAVAFALVAGALRRWR